MSPPQKKPSFFRFLSDHFDAVKGVGILLLCVLMLYAKTIFPTREEIAPLQASVSKIERMENILTTSDKLLEAMKPLGEISRKMDRMETLLENNAKDTRVLTGTVDEQSRNLLTLKVETEKLKQRLDLMERDITRLQDSLQNRAKDVK